MTAGKWGYTLAIKIRTDILRQGELRFVLELALMWVGMGVFCVAAFLWVRWGESLDAHDWWGAATLVCVVGIIPILAYIGMPRQLLGLGESTIRAVTYRCRRPRRFSVRWSDIEECFLRERCVGIAACCQRIALHRRSFAKEDWGLLRAELEAHLAPYFDFDAPTRYDLQRQRQRAWSIWRKVLDKIALLGAVVGIFGPLLLPVAVTSYFGWTESIPVGVIVCVSTIPSIVILIAVNRYAQRQEHERWHDRRVEPVG
ncbi:MAG: hypothetical protein V3T53_02080 [Phycisphaerales bacterium]